MKQVIILKWHVITLNKWTDVRVGQMYCMKNCEKSPN